MTEAQRIASKRRYQRENEAICPTCGGKGRILTHSARARSRKGGNESYRRSLEPGALSMSERGQRGGRPRALTLEDLGISVDH